MGSGVTSGAAEAHAALPRHPTWVLSMWGITPGQLSALLLAVSKLPKKFSGPKSLSHPPEPWTGTPEQKKVLKKLQQLMAERSSEGCSATHHDLIWFLRLSGFDVAKAQHKLLTMLSWRAAHGLHGLTVQHIEAELNTGKVYATHHPDKRGRPVFVVKVCRHRQGQFTVEDTRRLFTVVVDEAIKRLQPGQDQFVGIVDLQGFSTANIDLSFATFVIDAFLAMYPGRLAQMVLVDAPLLFRGPWELIKSLLGRHADLVHFASRSQLAQQFFTPDTLPDDFRKG